MKDNIYQYYELSENVKKKLREQERRCISLFGFHWENEIWEAVEEVANLLDCTYEKHAHDGVHYTIYFKYNGNMPNITGSKLKSYINDITYGYENKYYLDYDIIEVRDTYNYENGSLYDFIDVVSSKLSKDISDEFVYQLSDKGIDSFYDNDDDYYYENGDVYFE